jgi:benzoyl-CoA reductase/2-hydroxyglutaryl-CoA dehydratase subunit BcrC/BadD/HgdB
MPIRNLLAIVASVAMGVYAYFGITETLNQHSTRLELMEKDVELNTEFRIKWPRGLMGNLPADDEQYMLLEFLSGQVEKQQETLEENADTKIMIKHLEEMVDQLEKDVEKLKDATREIKFTNGNGNGNY